MPRWVCQAGRWFTNRAAIHGPQRILTKLGNFYESTVTPIATSTYTVLKCSFQRNWRCKNMKLVFRKFLQIFKCWSSIVYHLFRLKRNSKFQLELTLPSTFGWIFKRSKLYQTSPTTISRHSTHFIPNNRTKTSRRYLTILHFINHQKVYFQHNFKFLPIQRKGLILISILIFELSKYHGTTSIRQIHSCIFIY